MPRASSPLKQGAFEAWDQAHHQGPTQPPRLPLADQAHQVPVVADQIRPAISIVAMVFPLLYSQHALGSLGYQGGVSTEQVSPVYQELFPELCHHECAHTNSLFEY